MLHALYLGPSRDKWATSVYCIVRLGIVRIATQIALHSTRRMCTWARQGRNVWIVGVVGEKQTLPVIPPIPASSMSADVDLTKLGVPGLNARQSSCREHHSHCCRTCPPSILRKPVLSQEPAHPPHSAHPTAAWHRASSSLYMRTMACLFFLGT